jgi:homoserine dehydrogenase
MFRSTLTPESAEEQSKREASVGAAKSVGIAILGLGTIGSAVAKLVQARAGAISKQYQIDLSVKRVLERGPERAERGNLSGDLVTTSIDDILGDDSVQVVVETLGGEEPAAGYIAGALQAGKHVVTANKEALAKHFDRLQRAAASADRGLLFEASTGGGIPLLVSYRQVLAANQITSIRGILNGTTNYILTQMTDSCQSFDDALKAAQDLGYAEPDPTADVEGFDAAYKLSILASIMAGEHIHPDTIDRTGITQLSGSDIQQARDQGGVIKLLASAKLDNGSVTATVKPETVSLANLLAHVSANYNAVELTGDSVGPVLLSGQGAGPDPTASAIVSDIVEAIRSGSAANVPWN